jgi:hypothetical protein
MLCIIEARDIRRIALGHQAKRAHRGGARRPH